ncbi:MAG: thioredoxin domain-containing protein [Desulfohalobiaceae bacterium]|nr:thioredoxin domain-containing protein [Desulfohalobiaceae bacterium]
MAQLNSAGNRLAEEKSPYLLQHAQNPVDWYPWGEEAFAKAGNEDKPVFLSIGYATCHWCHVMAHESFEDRQVAELINQTFVPVKVDREERPDIDAVYMKTCQILTGRGGWPLTLFLTPGKEPFFAATYIPKEGSFPQTGLLELIPKIPRIWMNEREKVTKGAREILGHLRRTGSGSQGGLPHRSILARAVDDLSQRFDRMHGGFGNAPKFPSPHNLLFLLSQKKGENDRRLLEMVESTLLSMRKGGVFDQLGFGFHRYSTDKEWLVPHFEKMLYDQAMLSLAYLEAFEATGNAFYADTADEVFSYVLRDLTSLEGVFFSGEDADSEGVEGKFYVWSTSEIRDILPEKEAEVVIKAYNLKDEGNFRDEATRQLTGRNILHQLSTDLLKTAGDLGLSFEDVQILLDQARRKLFAAREKRIRPLLDDKVLTDWNGLMIAALAFGGKTLEREDYSLAASRAADLLLEKMRDNEGNLLHRYKDGEAGIPGFLDDYAFLAWGLLNLAEATGNMRYLTAASELTRKMLLHFRDEEQGGLFLSADYAETVLVRTREFYDGAIPSGNSAALMNIVRLIRAGENTGLQQEMQGLVQAFSGLIQSQPTGFTYFLCGLDLVFDTNSQPK